MPQVILVTHLAHRDREFLNAMVSGCSDDFDEPSSEAVDVTRLFVQLLLT
jgi:hypothetical protein